MGFEFGCGYGRHTQYSTQNQGCNFMFAICSLILNLPLFPEVLSYVSFGFNWKALQKLSQVMTWLLSTCIKCLNACLPCNSSFYFIYLLSLKIQNLMPYIEWTCKRFSIWNLGDFNLLQLCEKCIRSYIFRPSLNPNYFFTNIVLHDVIRSQIKKSKITNAYWEYCN